MPLFGIYLSSSLLCRFEVDAGVHASLVAYEIRWKDQADSSIDASDRLLIGQVSYGSGQVTILTGWVDPTGVVSGHDYDVEVRTEQLQGAVTVYGPWSDTGYDYAAA